MWLELGSNKSHKSRVYILQMFFRKTREGKKKIGRGEGKGGDQQTADRQTATFLYEYLQDI